jgi:hypothetical protein
MWVINLSLTVPFPDLTLFNSQTTGRMVSSAPDKLRRLLRGTDYLHLAVTANLGQIDVGNAKKFSLSLFPMTEAHSMFTCRHLQLAMPTRFQIKKAITCEPCKITTMHIKNPLARRHIISSSAKTEPAQNSCQWKI